MGRIFAIGDIHGRLDKLDQLLKRLPFKRSRDKLLFVGDYIDRGSDSKGVIDRLLHLQSRGVDMICLKGNHEQMFSDFYLAGHQPEIFLYNGGESTLISYGLEQREVRLNDLPPGHAEFFVGLKLYHQEGEYVFVHAGLRPGLPLQEQETHDLLWIRDEFFGAEYDWGFKIVFGHTPFRAPFRQDQLYGIDTGAVYGGLLTCLMLPDEEFIQV